MHADINRLHGDLWSQRSILLLIFLSDISLSQSRRKNGDPISTVTMRIPCCCRRADAVLKVHAAYNANNTKALHGVGCTKHPFYGFINSM